MIIHRSALEIALYNAIKTQEVREQVLGYTSDSGHLAVLRQMLKAVQQGEQLEYYHE